MNSIWLLCITFYKNRYLIEGKYYHIFLFVKYFEKLNAVYENLEAIITVKLFPNKLLSNENILTQNIFVWMYLGTICIVKLSGNL